MCVGCVAESSERREDREHREAQTSGNRTERTGTSAACRSTREIVAEKPRCRDRIFFEETCPSLLTVTQIRETNAQLQEDQSMYPPKKASPRSVRTGVLSWEFGTKGQVCLSGGTGPKAAARPRTKDSIVRGLDNGE